MTTSQYLAVAAPVGLLIMTWATWVTMSIFKLKAAIADEHSIVREMNVRIDRSTDRLDKINGHLEHVANIMGRIERNILRLADKAGIEGEQERPRYHDG